MSTKVIDISNPEYTEKFTAIRDKHGEFQNLKHYLEKIQFWHDNNLTEHGFYYLCYELINTPKDKNPKIFSLQPQTPDETRLLNEALFKFHFESGYNDRIDEINKSIKKSPLPINYIEECIKDIEDRYSIEVLPEVNVFNADYYGYTAAKQGRTENFYDFDIHKVINIVRNFATGAIDAHIQGYLREQLGNISSNATQLTPTKIDKISHKIILLHKTGVLNFIADKYYSGIKGNSMAKLIGSLFNADEIELETIRKTLTYLDTNNKKNPENETSLKKVKQYLLDFDINLPDLDKID